MSSDAEADANTFRFQGKHVSLTYPQCDLEPEVMGKKLTKLCSPVQLYVAQHLHKDGEPHLHVYLELASKPNIRDPRHFDVCGFHPNIQVCHKVADWIKYIKSKEVGNYSTLIDFTKVIRQCLTKRDLYNVLIENKQTHKYKFWTEYWEMNQQAEQYTPTKEFDWWDYADEYWTVLHKDGQRPLALYVWGPPDTGKSTYLDSRPKGELFVCTDPKHFHAYQGQKVIQIDNVEPHQWDKPFIEDLITGLHARTKPYYGSHPLPRDRYVYITSNLPAVKVFPSESTLSRLLVLEIDVNGQLVTEFKHRDPPKRLDDEGCD